MAIRFHLDEHVAPAIAEGLRARSIDVSTSQEAHLLGKDDTHQLLFATSQERTIVTCDDHFLRDEKVHQAPYGVCYCHPRKYTIGEFVNALLLVAECLEEEELRYSIHWL